MGRGYQGRRKSPVMDKVLAWGIQHPNTEFSLEAIAKSANVSQKQAASAMSRAHKGGFAKLGAVRGYWVFLENPIAPHPTVNRNGSSPIVSAIGVGDLLEVLRVRSDGDIVLMDGEKYFWVAKKVDI